MTKVKWQETNKGATPRLPPQTAEPFGQELLSVPPQIRCIVPSLTGTAPDDRLNPVSGRTPSPGLATLSFNGDCDRPREEGSSKSAAP